MQIANLSTSTVLGPAWIEGDCWWKAGGGRGPYYAPNPLRGGAAKGLGIKGLRRNSPRSCGIPHARENSECEIRKLESGPTTLLVSRTQG